MKAKYVFAGVLAILMVCTVLSGQAVSTSQVSGVVQDQSGAVVPGAEVQMTLVNTGQARTAVTDSNGYFILQELAVGEYRLDVSKSGFGTYVQNGIVLQVGVNPTVNATLHVGAQTQEVLVESNAAMVETETTGVGQVINQQQVEDLPLNGREIAQLITLSGASAASGSSVGDLNSNKNYGAGSANMANAVVTDAVAGGQGNTVAFVMDGGINNDPRNNLNAALPFPDAIQEFNVQTSSLGARYGQNSTAAVNIVTKGGTNAFHGDAFEYVRNFMFNARAANAPTRDSLKRNQFGGVVGGPIKKDKLFFFAGYQGTILKSNPTSGTAFVPTADELAGNFSVVSANAALCGLTPGVQLNESNPSLPEFTKTTNIYTGNLGPWQINPLAQTFLKYLPAAPTTGSLVQTACGQVTVPVTGNLTDKETIGRVDYNLSSKQTLFARYFLAINDQPTTSDGTDFLELNKMATYERDQETTIGDTYIIRPNLINNIRLTGNRFLNLRVGEPVPFGGSTHNLQGLTGTGGDCTANPSAADCSMQIVTPQTNYIDLSVSGGWSFETGGTNPGYFNSTLVQFADDVDWVRGKHEISIGFDFSFQKAYTVNTQGTNAIVSFSGIGTSDPSSAAGSGIGYADFESGLMAKMTQGNFTFSNEWSPYYGAYISDNWKLRRDFSIQLGIRYEPYIQERNINNHVSNVQIPAFVAEQHTKVYTNAPDGVFFDGDPGFPGPSDSESHYDRWAPRIGMVWSPKGDGKTSIRAGFGVFNNAAELFNYSHEAGNPPWGDNTANTSNATTVAPFSAPWSITPGGDPFPALSHLSPTSVFPLNATYTNQPLNMPPPYSLQWNLSVQHQFGSWLLAANYIGNGSRHLQSGYQADPTVYVPGTTAGGQCVAGGDFVGGPFNGLPDGLPATYNGACSASTGTPGNKVTNFTQRQYLYENGVNVSGQAAYFASIPQMDPGGNSNYNGLLLSANHRLSHDFSVLANYTYSHCLQIPVQDEWQGGTEYPVLQPISPSQPNLSLRSLSYHNCDSDIRHVMNISLIAATPKFSNHLLNAMLGGWQTSIIGGFHTGTYDQITTGVDTSLTNQTAYAQSTGLYQYAPNRGSFTPASGCTSTACTFQVNYLYAPAFAAPAIGTFGTQWAQDVVNPSYFDVDIALSRTFKIRESKSIQIRWETFNFDNHLNFGAPTTSMSSGTFGLITGIAGSPRIMQFATKFVF